MTAPRFDPASEAHHRFQHAARAAGMIAEDRWVDGYAAYEWDHLRPALQAYGIDVGGRDVLEFGCNVGGSAVVLAALGARLSGVDVDPAMLPIAQANLDRHGLPGTIASIGPKGRLPFADASFDLVLANSVLEYVEPDRLDRAIAEIHRVLRPGGGFFLCGTASRLAVRERHSGRWLINFLPRVFDRLHGHPLQRGLAPWRLAAALRGRFTESRAGMFGWADARKAIHGRLSPPIRAYALVGRGLGRSPGWFAPYIELLLRKAPDGGGDQDAR